MVRAVLFSLVIGGCLAGCAPAPSDTPAVAPSAPTAAGADHGHSHSTEKLSAEDQALADKQGKCPVGGTPLGDHGTPVKVMVGDRAVFICCEGCRSPLLKEPEKYLATLDAPAVDPAATTEAAPAVEAAPGTDTAPAAPTLEPAPEQQ